MSRLIKTILALSLAVGPLSLPTCAQFDVTGSIATGGGGGGRTYTAASCSTSDVQAAVTNEQSVPRDGDIIAIPAGTCSWTADITQSFTNSVSVIGAGSLSTTGGGDTTVIVDNDTTDFDHLIKFTTASGKSFRFAGITLAGGNGVGKQNGLLSLQGYSQALRVDHSHMKGTSYTTPNAYATLRIGGWQYGVVDHNILDGGSPVDVWDDLYNNDPSGAGNASWAAPSNLGSANAIFIETNTFNAPGWSGSNASTLTDCTAGGRYVLRYNTIYSAAAYVHPTGGSGQYRGCRTEEIYHNTYIGSNSTPTFTAFWTSSGVSVVWGNTAGIGFESLVDLHSMRRNNNSYTQSATPNGWGYCGTLFNGTGSAWDQSSSSSSGYRCMDQPGQGQGDLLSSSWFPATVNTVTGTISWPREALEPIYEWLDTWAQVPGYGSTPFNNTDSTAFVVNSDYYPYTGSFTGATGTGSGSLAARPSTCTPMVAYWATDTNTLYQCATVNTWTTYYTPYQYPYPY